MTIYIFHQLFNFYFSGSVEHRAQVTVYCLLMGEKYQQLVDNGLLYYFKTNHMQQIPMPPQEKRAIIIKRNDIAQKLTLEKEKQSLPGYLVFHLKIMIYLFIKPSICELP